MAGPRGTCRGKPGCVERQGLRASCGPVGGVQDEEERDRGVMKGGERDYCYV